MHNHKPLSPTTEAFLHELRALAHKYANTHAISYVIVPDDKDESACYEGNACVVCVMEGYMGLVQDKQLMHGHPLGILNPEKVH